ncbi:MAG: hypothetical protein LBO03_02665, partial [Acidaminococcales bacterium]|nr:hypothetical protein [Acidaminococcales bacterium]
CGFAALYADIAKDNRPSLSLFLKMGFAPVEKDATRWLPNGARHFSLSRERAVNGSQIQHDFNLRTVSEK